MKGAQILVETDERTASGTSEPVYGFGDCDRLRVQVDIDVVNGTSPTLVVVIEDSIDGGVNWNAVDTFPSANAAGVTVRNVTTSTVFGDVLRARWTIGGTSPEFTFGIALYAQ